MPDTNAMNTDGAGSGFTGSAPTSRSRRAHCKIFGAFAGLALIAAACAQFSYDVSSHNEIAALTDQIARTASLQNQIRTTTSGPYSNQKRIAELEGKFTTLNLQLNKVAQIVGKILQTDEQAVAQSTHPAQKAPLSPGNLDKAAPQALTPNQPAKSK